MANAEPLTDPAERGPSHASRGSPATVGAHQDVRGSEAAAHTPAGLGVGRARSRSTRGSRRVHNGSERGPDPKDLIRRDVTDT